MKKFVVVSLLLIIFFYGCGYAVAALPEAPSFIKVGKVYMVIAMQGAHEFRQVAMSQTRRMGRSSDIVVASVKVLAIDGEWIKVIGSDRESSFKESWINLNNVFSIWEVNGK